MFGAGLVRLGHVCRMWANTQQKKQIRATTTGMLLVVLFASNPYFERTRYQLYGVDLLDESGGWSLDVSASIVVPSRNWCDGYYRIRLVRLIMLLIFYTFFRVRHTWQMFVLRLELQILYSELALRRTCAGGGLKVDALASWAVSATSSFRHKDTHNVVQKTRLSQPQTQPFEAWFVCGSSCGRAWIHNKPHLNFSAVSFFGVTRSVWTRARPGQPWLMCECVVAERSHLEIVGSRFVFE